MLVLTRKTGQSIMIGDDIEVSVLAVSRDKIRIGITAPKEVPVFRKEVWISIKDGEGSMGGADETLTTARTPQRIATASKTRSSTALPPRSKRLWAGRSSAPLTRGDSMEAAGL